MAKKSKARKEPKRGKAKATKKQSRKEVERVLSGPVRRRTTPVPPKRPKTPALPGMEDKSKLSKKMLDIMDSMADQMHVINEANVTIKGLNNNALSQMKRDGVVVAKAHGIELVRVPGEEKLRKRLLNAGSADTDEDTTHDTDSGDDLDNGEGEDSGLDDTADLSGEANA